MYKNNIVKKLQWMQITTHLLTTKLNSKVNSPHNFCLNGRLHSCIAPFFLVTGLLPPSLPLSFVAILLPLATKKYTCTRSLSGSHRLAVRVIGSEAEEEGHLGPRQTLHTTAHGETEEDQLLYSSCSG